MKVAGFMLRIIPIRDLKDTAAISQMCSESSEPIYITKNGYGDMVIMSMKTYEESMALLDVYAKLAEAEEQLSRGKAVDARAALNGLRAKSARSTASANNHSECKERPGHTALASAAYSGNTWDRSMVQSSRTFTHTVSPAAPKSLAVYRPSSRTNTCTDFSAGSTIQYSRTPARW